MMTSSGGKVLKRFLKLALALSLALAAVPAWAGHRSDGDDLTLRRVVLRPGVTVDVHLRIFTNDGSRCEGKVILAFPGAAHTAATWAPLAEALFDRRRTGHKVCQVVAIDPPAHGGTGVPVGLVFGELTLDDYATVLLSVLQRLPRLGVRPDTVIAHSQGGLVLQLAQQRLADAGTDLRREFHVKHAVLLASVGPQAIPWNFVDSGVAGALLAAFVTSGPVLGAHVAIPDAAWPSVFFADLSGAVVPRAPAPDEVAARGWNAPEPLFGILQLVGAPPFARPEVAAGAFDPARGTTLHVVSYEQDTIVRPEENRMLYEHLTGDGSGSGFVEVSGPESVHDLHVADPRRLLHALAAARVRLP